MRYSFKTHNICSAHIEFDLDDNIVTNISFVGGCNGNLKAIAKLLEGKDANYIYNTLKGNTCGPKLTSCTDQLAKCVKLALEQNSNQ